MAEDNKVEFDEYGEIKLPEGQKPTEHAPQIDPDDEERNQGKTPTSNINELKERLANSKPVDINEFLKKSK